MSESNRYEQNPAVAEAFQTLRALTIRSAQYDEAVEIVRRSLPRSLEAPKLREVTDLIEQSQSVHLEDAEQALMHALLDEPLGFLAQMVDEVADTGAHSDCGDDCSHVQARSLVDSYFPPDDPSPGVEGRVGPFCDFGRQIGAEDRETPPCPKLARWIVRDPDFDDALPCDDHLNDRVGQCVGLSHGQGAAQVMLLHPGPLHTIREVKGDVRHLMLPPWSAATLLGALAPETTNA